MYSVEAATQPERSSEYLTQSPPLMGCTDQLADTWSAILNCADTHKRNSFTSNFIAIDKEVNSECEEDCSIYKSSRKAVDTTEDAAYADPLDFGGHISDTHIPSSDASCNTAIGESEKDVALASGNSISCLTLASPTSLLSSAPEWQSQFFKTKLCPYYVKDVHPGQESLYGRNVGNNLGTCTNGEKCRFSHSLKELRPLPDLRKTKLCPSFAKKEDCTVGHCPFAHTPEELRTSSSIFYKVTLCNFYKTGKCWNGPNCRFAHGTGELRAAQYAGHSPSDSRELVPPSSDTAFEGTQQVHRKFKDFTDLSAVSRSHRSQANAAPHYRAGSDQGSTSYHMPPPPPDVLGPCGIRSRDVDAAFQNKPASQNIADISQAVVRRRQDRMGDNQYMGEKRPADNSTGADLLRRCSATGKGGKNRELTVYENSVNQNCLDYWRHAVGNCNGNGNGNGNANKLAPSGNNIYNVAAQQQFTSIRGTTASTMAMEEGGTRAGSRPIRATSIPGETAQLDDDKLMKRNMKNKSNENSQESTFLNRLAMPKSDASLGEYLSWSGKSRQYGQKTSRENCDSSRNRWSQFSDSRNSTICPFSSDEDLQRRAHQIKPIPGVPTELLEEICSLLAASSNALGNDVSTTHDSGFYSSGNRVSYANNLSSNYYSSNNFLQGPLASLVGELGAGSETDFSAKVGADDSSPMTSANLTREFISGFGCFKDPCCPSIAEYLTIRDQGFDIQKMTTLESTHVGDPFTAWCSTAPSPATLPHDGTNAIDHFNRHESDFNSLTSAARLLLDVDVDFEQQESNINRYSDLDSCMSRHYNHHRGHCTSSDETLDDTPSSVIAPSLTELLARKDSLQTAKVIDKKNTICNESLFGKMSNSHEDIPLSMLDAHVSQLLHELLDPADCTVDLIQS